MPSDKRKTVGILAVQGDFAMHARMLDALGERWKLVKHVEDLADASALILPGGETTTMLKFLTERKLGDAIKEFAKANHPVFGTCAGAILMASKVSNPEQESLGLMSITIERNAYGRQAESSVQQGDCPELSDHPVEMVFIRAPIIRDVAEGIKILGRSQGLPVLVEEGGRMAATFHPELTGDPTIHRYFLAKVRHG